MGRNLFWTPCLLCDRAITEPAAHLPWRLLFAGEPRPHPAAVGVKRGRSDDSGSETDSSTSGQDGEAEDRENGDMDVKTALNLVAKHYTRNVSCYGCCLIQSSRLRSMLV